MLVPGGDVMLIPLGGNGGWWPPVGCGARPAAPLGWKVGKALDVSWAVARLISIMNRLEIFILLTVLERWSGSMRNQVEHSKKSEDMERKPKTGHNGSQQCAIQSLLATIDCVVRMPLVATVRSSQCLKPLKHVMISTLS